MGRRTLDSFTGMMGIASSGLFIWAGVLLMQYQKKGVWVGFGSVGINLLSGLIFTMVVAKEATDELGDDAGGFFASLGLICRYSSCMLQRNRFSTSANEWRRP